MIFYPNLNKGNLKYKNYNLLDFDNQMNSKIDEKKLPFGRCKTIYNYSCSSGALHDGIGLSELKLIYNNDYDLQYKTLLLPTTNFVHACYFLRYWLEDINSYMSVLITYCADDKLYYNYLNSSDTEWYEISNLSFKSTPTAIYSKFNGDDSLIFYSDEDGMFVWNINIHDVIKVENPPKITSMCIHDNRLFATIDGEAKSIIFSEELNPINFNVSVEEGGYINMSDDFGKCNKVYSK